MTLFAFAQKAAQDVAVRGRLALSTFLNPNGLLRARSGFMLGGAAVAVVSGTMDVTVGQFRAMVDGSTSGQGVYPVVNTGTITVTLPNGGGSDTLYTIALVVQDNAFDSSGFTDPKVVAYTGTPPAGTILPIRAITVPAGKNAGNGGLVSGNLGSDLRQYTAALGAPLPVTGQTQRDAWTSQDGDRVYRIDTGDIEIKSGGSWRTLWSPNNTPPAKIAFTPTLASGFKTPTDCWYREHGNGLITLHMMVLRSSDLVVGATGNVADVAIVNGGGLPANARPDTSGRRWNGAFNTGVVGGLIWNSGQITIRDASGGQTINTNEYIEIHETYTR